MKKGMKILIKEECANFQTSGPFGKMGYCWMKETSNGGTCIFFSQVDNPKCEYLEKVVSHLEGK